MIHIIPYKPLARCNIDELAAEQRYRERQDGSPPMVQIAIRKPSSSHQETYQ